MRDIAHMLMPHLLIAPILLPLVSAALLLLLDGRRYRLRGVISLVTVFANLVVSALLMAWTGREHPAAYGVYLPSNWDMPFGIVLVADRLSALLLVTAAVVALMALLFALARWHKAGAHFHPLFLLQIVGLNGAFLTGDLFNLFVFFEVMLAASYGLLLHGSGPSRVRGGLHYVAVNLFASSLFLIGASLIYGVTGTLNMADIAARIPDVTAADRPLLHAAFAILGVAFLTKAAMWPLNFWLVPAYSSACAPAGAVFALLTKVGVYVLLRFSSLMFSDQAGASAGFGAQWLVWGGTATLAAGAFGMFSTQRPARLAGFVVIVSSGTLLAVLGLARPDLTGGALFYLPGATLGAAAFFLLAELMERSRSTGGRAPEDEEDHLPFALAELELDRNTNLDDEEDVLIGQAIPASTALLGLAFICCTLLVAGLPPLSGFIGKFVLLSALLPGLGASTGALADWVLPALIVLSGLCALIALSRVGIRYFWAPVGREAPVLRVIEFMPVVLLIALSLGLSIRAEPLMRYAMATAASLQTPEAYIHAVLSARPLPTPSNADRLGLPSKEMNP